MDNRIQTLLRAIHGAYPPPLLDANKLLDQTIKEWMDFLFQTNETAACIKAHCHNLNVPDIMMYQLIL